MNPRTHTWIAALMVAGGFPMAHAAGRADAPKPVVSKGERASGSGSARAAAPEGTPAPPPVSAPPVARLENGILKFDPLTIQGRVPKPTSIYAGEPERPPFTDLVPEDSLLPKILESVEEEPF